MIEISDIS